MAGYDPKRPRPRDTAPVVGLPGDPEPSPPRPPIAAVPDIDDASGPTRRALPRAAPPLDRHLPPAALIGAGVVAVAMIVAWRRWQRRET